MLVEIITNDRQTLKQYLRKPETFPWEYISQSHSVILQIKCMQFYKHISELLRNFFQKRLF